MGMKQNEKNKSGRRGFLAALVRGAAVVGMGGFAAGMFVRRRKLVREGKCIDPAGRTVCDACREYPACGLPRALYVKKAKRGQV